MKRKLLYTLAALALAAFLPAEATWTYVDSPGKYNNNSDKEYTGAITDGANWTIYVLRLSDETWQIGAGTFGVTDTCGAAVAGSESSKAPISYDGTHYTGSGAGVLDLSTLTTDLPSMVFSAIGPRFLYKHDKVTKIVMPSTIKTVGQAAFAALPQLAELDLSRTQIKTIPDWTDGNGNAQRYGLCQNSTALEKVFLPETLTYVGKYAFGWLLKQNAVIHFLGDVPTFHADGAIAGSNQGQYALCVNALKYPNWRTAYAEWKYDVDAKMAGQSWPSPKYSNETDGWIPRSVRFSTNSEWPAPFGAVSSRTCGVIQNNRVYLIQEGEAGAQTPASSAVIATEVGRTNVTFEVTAYLGTSPSAELSFTFNGQTVSETVTVDGATYTFSFYDIDLDTAYPYSAVMTASSGNGTTAGSITTVGPDVKLGATDYLQPNDGLSAKLTVNVAQLLSGTAAIVLSRDGTDIETKTVSEAGDVAFDVSGLTLWQTYDYTFTATSSEHGDVATATLSFKAQPYHWEYTPNDGETQAYPWDGTPPQAGVQKGFLNNQPYHGTLTDGRWVFCVYHNPEWKADEFWLGEGNSGSTAYSQKGLPDIDLSGVYDDTGIKLVGIGGYAFDQKSGDIHSIVFPKFITHIGKRAFYKCSNLKDIDLGETSLTNILEMGFQDCTSLTNIVFPATLETLGGTALAWGPDKRAIHFLGDVPVCEPSVSSGTKGSDQAIYSGANNRQWAYCVDAEKYPRWKTDATTKLYTTENPFPSGEATWMAEHVRKGQPYANGKKTYGYPFGNSTLGRGYDSSSNGRAYLIQETQVVPGFTMKLR